MAFPFVSQFAAPGYSQATYGTAIGLVAVYDGPRPFQQTEESREANELRRKFVGLPHWLQKKHRDAADAESPGIEWQERRKKIMRAAVTEAEATPDLASDEVVYGSSPEGG